MFFWEWIKDWLRKVMTLVWSFPKCFRRSKAKKKETTTKPLTMILMTTMRTQSVEWKSTRKTHNSIYLPMPNTSSPSFSSFSSASSFTSSWKSMPKASTSKSKSSTESKAFSPNLQSPWWTHTSKVIRKTISQFLRLSTWLIRKWTLPSFPTKPKPQTLWDSHFLTLCWAMPVILLWRHCHPNTLNCVLQYRNLFLWPESIKSQTI